MERTVASSLLPRSRPRALSFPNVCSEKAQFRFLQQQLTYFS